MSSLNEVRDMLLISHSLNIITDEELLLLMLENSGKRSRKSSFPYDDYEPFSLDDMDEDECKSDFRFEKDHIPWLAELLELPEKLSFSGSIKVENVEGLCLVLKQMTNPCQKNDLIQCFGRPITELRMITNKVIDYLYRAHKHRITKWNEEILSSDYLQQYSAAISSKGGVLENCFGFVDCPVRQNNRKIFNEEKPVYSLKYQNVVLPNGMIAHTYGPIDGKRHDSTLLGDSNLLPDLEQFASTPNGHTMCIYGNPSYPIRIHLKAPYKQCKDSELTPEKEAYNKSMSEVKSPTEWLFPDVFNSFKFLDYQNNHKISLDYVSKMHVVCCLVQNALTCFYGNETAKFFNLEPPAIEDYFS
ncbi:uncharacterized protein LOC116287416 [Actinia tenebrosa]|uniref:Uncharacterized protein LOC116287416 n=1 Tax=Actinia tenebrosa TaxID=6105 RepID=A0A6P8H2X3_ACTTE|nr:uncharacterized protein LOC116287416 [Actinia tenebrosa]